MSDGSNFGQYTLYQHNLSAYMRLDASALRALNLMPGPNDGANKSMSLFGLLNKCKTALGTRLLAQWLKQPLLDLPAIEQRQILVEAFVLDTEVRQTLQVPLLDGLIAGGPSPFHPRSRSPSQTFSTRGSKFGRRSPRLPSRHPSSRPHRSVGRNPR
jgi:hypothetical protein